MPDAPLDVLNRGIAAASSRRTALATLLAGATALGSQGLSPAPAAAKKNGKGNREDKPQDPGNDGVSGNPHNAVAIAEESVDIDGDGAVSGSAECPKGYLALNGDFSVDGADAIAVETNAAAGDLATWDVTVTVSNVGENAALNVRAICLRAKLIADEDDSAERRQRGRGKKNGHGRGRGKNNKNRDKGKNKDNNKNKNGGNGNGNGSGKDRKGRRN